MLHEIDRFRDTMTGRALALALTTFLASACGGGGGGSSEQTTLPPVEEIPPPVDVIPPEETPEARAQIIVQSSDRVAGGDMIVGNIEDGALAADGTIAMIISVGAPSSRRAVLVRQPGEDFEPLFDESSAPPDIDLRSLFRLRMSPTGEMIFQSGEGLDTDRLFVIDDDGVRTLAGAAPGVQSPEFRVIGNVRVTPGGTVAFAGGGQECETSITPGGSVRNECTVALFVADSTGVQTLDLPDIDLRETRTNVIRVEVAANGTAYFSLPGRNQEPTVVRYRDGETETLLFADTVIESLGTAMRDPEAVAINGRGEILLSGALPPPADGEPRPDILGVLVGDEFRTIATEGTIENGQVLSQERGVGLDEAGNALWDAAFEDESSSTGLTRALRIGGGPAGAIEILREGQIFPGTERTIIRIESSRMNGAGDVALVVSLGRITAGTTFIEEVRAAVRRANGDLVTVASSTEASQIGIISDLAIVGFDEEGTVLLLAERNQSNVRALLLARSD